MNPSAATQARGNIESMCVVSTEENLSSSTPSATNGHKNSKEFKEEVAGENQLKEEDRNETAEEVESKIRDEWILELRLATAYDEDS